MERIGVRVVQTLSKVVYVTAIDNVDAVNKVEAQYLEDKFQWKDADIEVDYFIDQEEED